MSDWQPIDHIINAALKPFGLMFWRTMLVDEDEHGLPVGPIKVIGWRIGRRP